MSAPTTGRRFVPPPDSDAAAPPERRGLTRDGVRLLVANRDGVHHHRFAELGRYLRPGDLVVVNTSATLPAAVDTHRADGRPLTVHVSTELDDGDWVVEPRRPDGPDREVSAGDPLALPGGVTLRLRAPYPRPSAAPRLWRARPEPFVGRRAYLAGHGRPISYRYVRGSYPLSDYQNVYARVPGSAEMASAGRPITDLLLVGLLADGVTVAPLVLHAGVSSPEKHEPPLSEPYLVPAATARLVSSARAAGARVVAVGTTVVRALESVAAPDGTVRPGAGWTDLVLGPSRPACVVNGLVSGLHPPEDSHLMLLDAVAGADLVDIAYQAVTGLPPDGDELYRWHEFGDSMLLLP